MAKKENFPTQQVPDPAQIKPQSAAEYSGRGWLYFSRQQYLEAQSDLETAISLDAHVDYFYTLGLILRARGKNSEALAAFEKALALVSDSENQQRTTMLRRLTLGQINMIKSGDWNLEKEVWKRIR